MNSPITHYQAQIKLSGHYFPERGELTDEVALLLVNNGTTPEHVSPLLRAKADRLKAALTCRLIVSTATADILPLTTTDYKTGRITPTKGVEAIKTR